MWMSLVAFLGVSGIVLEIAEGIVVNPCTLTDVFINKFKVNKANAAHWVCLVKYASGFNTQALGSTHKDGSDDFGIFQINDKYCRKGTKTSCGVECTDLFKDDITSSATCAFNIFQKEGFASWPAWKENCKDINVSRFIDKCDVKG